MGEYNDSQIAEALDYVSPDQISDFQGFLNFTAACVSAGVSQDAWDRICSSAPGYNQAENYKHWNSLRPDDGSSGVPGDYIVKLAYKNGYRTTKKGGQPYSTATTPKSMTEPQNNTTTEPLTWDDICEEIDAECEEEPEAVAINTDTTADERKQQFITWLTALFNPTEVPNVHTRWMVKTNSQGIDKYIPCDGGESSHTVAEIVEALKDSSLEETFGLPANNAGGVWIACNPQKMGGTTAQTVTRYTHVLVESDTMPVDEQIKFLKATHLPIATLTYSGSKSVHAIIKIDAKDAKEYASRVDMLFKQLEAWGYDVDKANKNPNRLTRAAGFMRGEQCQTLIDTDLGFDSFEEWQEWIEDKQTDKMYGSPVIAKDLVDNETDTQWLVKDVFHKSELVLMVGQSKAGKSLVTMAMGISIAAGVTWMGHGTEKSNVLYCNFEIAGVMAENRRNGIAREMGLTANDIRGFRLWNLAGRIDSVDDFIKRLAIKVKLTKSSVVVIDPIYILEAHAGIDENDSVAVTSLLDKLISVKTKTGCSIILVHHISSKIVSMKSYSIDSLPQGSSAFSRIYDAMIALQELDIDELPVKEAKKAFRLSYSNRNSEGCRPDSVWGTYPLYSTQYNNLLEYCPLVSSDTYERREKERKDELDAKIHSAQYSKPYGWDTQAR